MDHSLPNNGLTGFEIGDATLLRFPASEVGVDRLAIQTTTDGEEGQIVLANRRIFHPLLKEGVSLDEDELSLARFLLDNPDRPYMTQELVAALEVKAEGFKVKKTFDSLRRSIKEESLKNHFGSFGRHSNTQRFVLTNNRNIEEVCRIARENADSSMKRTDRFYRKRLETIDMFEGYMNNPEEYTTAMNMKKLVGAFSIAVTIGGTSVFVAKKVFK